MDTVLRLESCGIMRRVYSVLLVVTSIDYYWLSYFLALDSTLERFLCECRKVIGFASTSPHDWLKKLAPLFYSIRSKTKTNRRSLANVFPRFASATCNYFEF